MSSANADYESLAEASGVFEESCWNSKPCSRHSLLVSG